MCLAGWNYEKNNFLLQLYIFLQSKQVISWIFAELINNTINITFNLKNVFIVCKPGQILYVRVVFKKKNKRECSSEAREGAWGLTQPPHSA